MRQRQILKQKTCLHHKHHNQLNNRSMMNLGCSMFIFMFMNNVVMSLCVRNKVGITFYFNMFINKFICFYHATIGVYVDML